MSEIYDTQQSVEVVDRGSETQVQVTKMSI